MGGCKECCGGLFHNWMQKAALRIIYLNILIGIVDMVLMAIHLIQFMDRENNLKKDSENYQKYKFTFAMMIHTPLWALFTFCGMGFAQIVIGMLVCMVVHFKEVPLAGKCTQIFTLIVGSIGMAVGFIPWMVTGTLWQEAKNLAASKSS